MGKVLAQKQPKQTNKQTTLALTLKYFPQKF